MLCNAYFIVGSEKAYNQNHIDADKFKNLNYYLTILE